ncbi:MAG: hypothetical protein ACON4E_08060 [Flavobacteriales bacterium]
MVIYSRVTYGLICIILWLLVSACGSDDDIILSNVPNLSFNSLSPTSVQEFDGPITFTVDYEDGDGDLGENDPNVKNLYLKDNRNGIIYEYRLQQLAPEDSNIPITGSFDIVLNNTAITNGSSEQSATFDIYVVDREGNRSNTITSDPLNIYQ